mgnify:CR=1 FL=1
MRWLVVLYQDLVAGQGADAIAKGKGKCALVSGARFERVANSAAESRSPWTKAKGSPATEARSGKDLRRSKSDGKSVCCTAAR